MSRIEFFGVTLEEALDFALDLAPVVGTVLRIAKKCFRCGQRDRGRIGNRQSNHFDCRNCHAQVSQYTNACSFTVNPYTGQIGHAAHVPAGQKWRWTKEGGFFQDKVSKLWIPYYVKAKGLKGRSLVIETVISEYHTGRFVRSHSSVLDATSDNSVWEGLSHIFPSSNLKTSEKILAVDGRLRSEYGELVFEDRRIITPWK